MPIFRLLAEPDRYVACDWDLTADRAGLDYWVGHFLEHYTVLERLIREEYGPTDGQLERFRAEYLAEIERLGRRPEEFGRVTILTLDRLRDHYLRKHGFADPFRHVKRKENEAALAVYPELVAELDRQPADRRLLELLQGVFAGNIFDLGAMATVRQYHAEGLDFFTTRGSLPPRPWLVDDPDRLAEAWSPERWRYRKVLFFADNAGCDFVLGCLPLIREFAGRQAPANAECGMRNAESRIPSSPANCQVVIAVNSGPSLNDILRDEAEFVLAAARRADPVLDRALAEGRIRLVESGNSAPLIDLAEVSDELNAAAEGTDLLVLEGMGRSVESNHFARFTADTAKLALLKDPRVAGRIGGRLFDICCKFEPV